MVYLGFPVVAALSAALVARNGMTTPFGWALIVAFAIFIIVKQANRFKRPAPAVWGNGLWGSVGWSRAIL